MQSFEETPEQWKERLVFENVCKQFYIRVTGETTRKLDLPGMTVAYRPLDLVAGIKANERIIKSIKN